MALNGRAGQRFSQAPQPMQRSSFTAGMRGDLGSSGSRRTILIAPAGQWRAQLLQLTPSVLTSQFSAIHTAWPIWIYDFPARSVRRMAPVGHTSAHFVHSGRQYPRSNDISGCMRVISLPDGRNT